MFGCLFFNNFASIAFHDAFYYLKGLIAQRCIGAKLFSSYAKIRHNVEKTLCYVWAQPIAIFCCILS